MAQNHPENPLTQDSAPIRNRPLVEYHGAIDPAVATQYQSTRDRMARMEIVALVKSAQSLVSETITPSEAHAEAQAPSGHVDAAEPANAAPEPSEPLVMWRELDRVTKALWVDPKTGEVLREKPSIFNTTDFDDSKSGNSDQAFSPPSSPKLNTTFSALSVSANVEKHGISRTAIEGTFERFCKRLEVQGFNTTNIARIKIGYSVSGKVGVHRRFTGGYRVTVPLLKRSKILKALNKPPDRRTTAGKKAPKTYEEPTKGIRSDFWREYRKALAFTYLDKLKAEKPDQFKALKAQLEPAYREHNTAILDYIKNTNMRNKSGLTHHFRRTGELSGWTKRNLKAEGFGLSDHTPRPNWKTDSASLMAEIQQRGFEATEERYSGFLLYAENTAKKATRKLKSMTALDKISGKAKAEQQAINRATARRNAVLSTLKKLHALRPLFQPDSVDPENHRLEDFEIRAHALDLAKSRKKQSDKEVREMKAEQTFRKMEKARKRKRKGKKT